MSIITTTTYARVGLIGNPSSGYWGKTIAFSIRNFNAQVTLHKSSKIEIIPHKRNDPLTFSSLSNLAENISSSGYYGGIRIIKAALKKFYDYCQQEQINLEQKNFAISYDSNIPFRVGLSGSSAIIISVIKALMQFYNVEIDKTVLANLALSIEKDELGIMGGLMDRVIQVYTGLLYMDFNRQHMEKYGYGIYQHLQPPIVPNFYIAYSEELSEGAEMVHNIMRQRYNAGDPQVHKVMQQIGELSTQFRNSLFVGDLPTMNSLINRNFDLRASIYQISKGNLELINCTRNVGASAKFAGSGGAIVGIYADENMYHHLEAKLKKIRAHLIKPIIFNEKDTLDYRVNQKEIRN